MGLKKSIKYYAVGSGRFKKFFSQKGTFFNFVTLEMGVFLHFSLHLANPKSKRSGFGIVFKANNGF